MVLIFNYINAYLNFYRITIKYTSNFTDPFQVQFKQFENV